MAMRIKILIVFLKLTDRSKAAIVKYLTAIEKKFKKCKNRDFLMILALFATFKRQTTIFQIQNHGIYNFLNDLAGLQTGL